MPRERPIGTRRGAVDLVGQHDVGKQRPRAKLELAALLVEDHRAGHVGRQQIGRALHARKAQARAAATVRTSRVLATPVRRRAARAVGQQGDRYEARLVGFADDDAPTWSATARPSSAGAAAA